MKEFKAGQTISINKKQFDITHVEACTCYPGQYVLTGTKQGDPSFLAGKRTLFTAYLSKVDGRYTYDWNAK